METHKNFWNVVASDRLAMYVVSVNQKYCLLIYLFKFFKLMVVSVLPSYFQAYSLV
jgi:hypothetical protein